MSEHYYTIAGSGGAFTLTYEMYTFPDQADIYVNAVLVISTNGQVSGSGTLTLPSTIALQPGDKVDVVMTGTDGGTAWDYTVDYSGGLQTLNYVASGMILNDDAASLNHAPELIYPIVDQVAATGSVFRFSLLAVL